MRVITPGNTTKLVSEQNQTFIAGINSEKFSEPGTYLQFTDIMNEYGKKLDRITVLV